MNSLRLADEEGHDGVVLIQGHSLFGTISGIFILVKDNPVTHDHENFPQGLTYPGFIDVF